MLNRSAHSRIGPLVSLSVFLVTSCCVCHCTAQDVKAIEPVRKVTRDVGWDGVFIRQRGWTGGDVAGSIDLDDQRTLWLFGDSWIGKVADHMHQPGSKLVNNSIAVHRRGSRKKNDLPEKIDFFWGDASTKEGPAKGKPTAWIVPQRQFFDVNSRFTPDNLEATWYWTTGGGAVAIGSDGKRRVVLFLFHVARPKNGKGVWNFETIGTVMAVIDNPGDPVDQWSVRQLPLPFSYSYVTPAGDSSDAGDGRRQELVTWGVAALRLQKTSTKIPSRYLYIYGVRSPVGARRQLVLARVPEEQMDDIAAWRFFAGERRWSKLVTDAAAIADGVPSELSVEDIEDSGQERLVMIHSEPLLGPHIFARNALRPEGPWSAPRRVFLVDDIQRNKNYFTYAAKGHARLSKQGELLVSYLVNSQDFGAMFRDTDIYRPRFIRVPLELALPKMP